MGDWNPIKEAGLKSHDPQTRSHLYRYYSARGFVEPGDIVTDCACGAGYGTNLLSRVAKKVVGIDKDDKAIKYAMENCKRKNNYFMQGNLDQLITLPECDVAISIETLEHLRFPKTFAAKLKRSARKRIYVTTPIVPTKDTDPTHLHDFKESDVLEMFVDDHWKSLDGSIQGIYFLVCFYKI